MSEKLTNARAAEIMTYIAASAASWAGSMLTLPETVSEPAKGYALSRFVDEIEGKLSILRVAPTKET